MARNFGGRRSFQRGRGAARKFVWASAEGVISSSVSSVVDLLGEFKTALGSDVIGSTVMRIRGTVLPAVEFTDQPLVQTEYHYDMGIIVESDAMAGLAAADQPPFTPSARPNDDWMFWRTFWWTNQTSGASILDLYPGGPSWMSELDGKAERKLEELGEGLLLWVDKPGGDATEVYLNYGLKIGLKLP